MSINRLPEQSCPVFIKLTRHEPAIQSFVCDFIALEIMASELVALHDDKFCKFHVSYAYACISDACAAELRRRFVTEREKKQKRKKTTKKTKFKPRLLCLGNNWKYKKVNSILLQWHNIGTKRTDYTRKWHHLLHKWTYSLHEYALHLKPAYKKPFSLRSC